MHNTPVLPSSSTVPRIALVSCVKTKRNTPSVAKELYASPFFRGMRAFAESQSDAWFVLSAEHGVVEPDTVLAPYEKSLKYMPAAARKQWARMVQQQLAGALPQKSSVIVLAGTRYREGLVPFLTANGHTVSIPMKGLSFGKQLQFLKFARECFL